MSQLILKVTGAEQGALGSNAEIRFDENGGTIGRAQTNRWALPDPACYLSSQHALVSFQGGKFYITDLSSNGTYVNGQDAPIGKNNTVCFDDVSSLSMGPYSISVEQPGASELDGNKTASLTAMFAPQSFDSSPSAQPNIPAAPTPGFSDAGAGQEGAADPLALLGGSPDPVPDFPENWAADDSISSPVSSTPSSLSEQDLVASNQINDAFTPPQNTPNPQASPPPELPPENWDDTMFTPVSTPKQSDMPPSDTSQEKLAQDPFSPNTDSTPSASPFGGDIPDDPDFFGAASSPTPSAPVQQAAAAPPTPPEPSPVDDDETLIGLDTHSQAPSDSSGQDTIPPVEDFQTPPPSAQENSLAALVNRPSESAPPTQDKAPVQAAAPLEPTPAQATPPIEQAPAQPETSSEKASGQPVNLDSMMIAEATFRANGLDTELLKDPQFVDQAVALLPYFLEGTLNILQSRAQVKNELRASKTIFQAIDNNPLKYSVNLHDAIQNLFTHRRPGFLSPNDAIKEAFIDIGKHETALVSGIQGGLNGLLEKIKPETIEQRIEANESKKNLFGKISSSKKWDFYKETYSHITDTSGDSFLELFGSDFLNAYETHINQKDQDGK